MTSFLLSEVPVLRTNLKMVFVDEPVGANERELELTQNVELFEKLRVL